LAEDSDYEFIINKLYYPRKAVYGYYNPIKIALATGYDKEAAAKGDPVSITDPFWKAQSHPDLYDFPITPFVLQEGVNSLQFEILVGSVIALGNAQRVKRNIYSNTLCIGISDR
jgi:hypothetical protein